MSGVIKHDIHEKKTFTDCFSQDAYEELVMIVGSRRSGLNQNMALRNQYERVLQDLIDLVDTARDKMTADQKMIASSADDVQNLLDKHKVRGELKNIKGVYIKAKLENKHCVFEMFPGVFPGLGVAHGSNRDVL